MVKGIDIAKWNPVQNYAAVQKAGVQFAIVKVINQKNKPDGLFETHYKGLTGAGVPVVGGYNYSYATTVAKAEEDARAWLRVANGRIPVCWLDVEDKCQQDIGHLLIDIIKAYQKIIEAAAIKFGVYTGLYFYNTYIKPFKLQLNCQFWIARYPSKANMLFSSNPNESKKPSIYHILYGWQYASTGIVYGITGKVDLNVLYSSAVVGEIEYYRIPVIKTGSIVAALNNIVVPCTKEYRKKIADANGISNYSGTYEQNVKMLELLKSGKLKKV